MKELLDWVEKNALENLRARLQNAEVLAKEASSALTLALAGVGGGLAYGIKALESGPLVPWAMALWVAVAWLAICAGLVLVRCIQTRELELPTNSPRNLWQPKFGVDALREVELDNIQGRIDRTAERNQQVAYWLDRCRLMLVATPAVYLAAFLCAVAVGRVAGVVPAG